MLAVLPSLRLVVLAARDVGLLLPGACRAVRLGLPPQSGVEASTRCVAHWLTPAANARAERRRHPASAHACTHEPIGARAWLPLRLRVL